MIRRPACRQAGLLNLGVSPSEDRNPYSDTGSYSHGRRYRGEFEILYHALGNLYRMASKRWSEIEVENEDVLDHGFVTNCKAS